MSEETLTTTIPEQREWTLKRPGNINFADARGAYPGCKLVDFATTDEANEFFKDRAGLLVVDYQVGNSGRVFMLISKQMDEQEMEEFNEYQSIVGAKMREWNERRDAEKKSAAEAAAKEKADRELFLKEAKQAVKEIADLRKAHEELKAKYADVKRQLKAESK